MKTRRVFCLLGVFAGAFSGALLLGCSEDEPTFVDVTPPGRVVDLAAEPAGARGVVLTWTAPGDDDRFGQVAGYDIRYRLNSLSGADFDSAHVLTPAPAPQISGATQTVTIAELPFGDWRFGLRSSDDAGNRSELSNVAAVLVQDLAPPARINDLSIVSQVLNEATLQWTAPGDDGSVGTVASYSLRRSYDEIDDDSWETAVEVAGLPSPDSSGSQQSVEVHDLDPRRAEYFAIRALDPQGNWSEISNLVRSQPSDFVQLTNSPVNTGAFAPSISPDGSKIAFQAYWDGELNPQLYVMSSDGSDIMQITDDLFGASNPDWSPDGATLAFVVWTDNPPIFNFELSIIEAVAGAKPQLVASHLPRVVSGPSWSPDGNWIVYSVRSADNVLGPSDLYVVSAAGGEPLLLESDGSRNRIPAWSPTGTEIAFTSNRSGDDEIWVIPADGGTATQVTAGSPFSDTIPAWSPDGTSIVFTSVRTGSQDLFVVSLEGGAETQLTFEPLDQGDADWSPTGDYIVFTWVGVDRADIWAIRGGFDPQRGFGTASSR